MRGAWALGIRQVFVQLVSAAAVVVLARVLDAGEFGFYAVTLFLMHVLVVAGDAGLAAALVRDEGEPDDRDYQAVFTFQQVASLALAAAGAAILAVFPELTSPERGLALLLPAALAALVLTSFVTTPVARLERHLDFDRIAALEVAQALAFNGVAVAGALAGLGANAMAAALAARAATGVVLVHCIEPWPRRWRWDWSRVRPRLRFGMAYQAATAVSLVREAIVPVFVGAAIGSAAVGTVYFAQLLAMHALVVVYMLQRVLLPLFARVQTSREDLTRAVESSMFAVAALVVPVQTTVLALQEPVVRIVFGEQWLESLPVFRWLWASAVLEPQLVVAIPLLNALGASARTLRMALATTLLGWAAGVPLLLLLGPVGFGVASVLLLGVKWRLIRDADRISGVASPAVVAPAWIAGAFSAALAWLAAWQWPPADVFDLALLVALALVLYAAALAALAFDRVTRALAWLRREVREGEAAVAAGAIP
jgi:teichuronic acid exporter